jgi:hypothetical protein
VERKMGAKVEVAKHRLFDENKLNVADVKLFPGSSRDVTPEDIADQLNRVISQLENGDYDLVDDDC